MTHCPRQGTSDFKQIPNGTERRRMSTGLENLRVLLADDNAHMRSIVGAVLKSIGIQHLREAHNGAQALTILREWPVDVAIVDFRMEPIDGVEFTRLVRQAEDSVNPFL